MCVVSRRVRNNEFMRCIQFQTIILVCMGCSSPGPLQCKDPVKNKTLNSRPVMAENERLKRAKNLEAYICTAEMMSAMFLVQETNCTRVGWFF